MSNSIVKERLASIIDRYERLDEEKRAIASDQKDIMTEAKSAGFDLKALREVLRRRKKDSAEISEHDMLVGLYESAIADFSTTPLGEYAGSRNDD